MFTDTIVDDSANGWDFELKVIVISNVNNIGES